jgi:hypothetical protein
MMTNHMADRLTYHACGGTILTGGSGDQAHEYCDRCGAFRYVSDDAPTFPAGTDETANRNAWDAGHERSPDA